MSTMIFVTHDQEEAMSLATRSSCLSQWANRARAGSTAGVYRKSQTIDTWPESPGKANLIPVRVSQSGMAAFELLPRRAPTTLAGGTRPEQEATGLQWCARGMVGRRRQRPV